MQECTRKKEKVTETIAKRCWRVQVQSMKNNDDDEDGKKENRSKLSAREYNLLSSDI